jgi:hypothetical protein
MWQHSTFEKRASWRLMSEVTKAPVCSSDEEVTQNLHVTVILGPVLLDAMALWSLTRLTQEIRQHLGVGVG